MSSVKNLYKKGVKPARTLSMPVEDLVFETVLNLPEWLSMDLNMNPVFGLTLEIVGSELRFDMTEEDIIKDTMKMIDKVIESGNDFIRPEFAQLDFLSHEQFVLQEEEEERMRKVNFQSKENTNEFEGFMFRGQESNIYSKFMGRVKLTESPKDKKDIIFTQEEAHIFNQTHVDKYMKIASVDEECYVEMKERIKLILYN